MKNSGVIAWLFTGLAAAVAVAYAVVLALGPPNMTATVLDFSAKVIGPLGAALIAWAGVSHTVANARLQDTAKEWHQDLRWATELCLTGEPKRIGIGIALLDELDDRRFLDHEQVRMVGRITDEVLQNILAEEPDAERSGEDAV